MAAKVGLTGGIGSGKTTVANCFAKLGVQVIDADRIAHALTEPGSAQFEEILEYFGGEVLDPEGRLDRKRLGGIVFESAQKRKRLEAILHPPIRTEMYARAQRDEGRYCVLDIPLLIESGQHREMERVVAVTCSQDTRIRRLRRDRQMTRGEIERVMDSQVGEQARLAVADDVIDNAGGVGDIEARVAELHRGYLELFR